MSQPNPAMVAEAVSSLSPVSLASILDQSVDCVKVIGLGGDLQYMNGNGLCAMEIDDFCTVKGQQWAALWPDEARYAIEASYVTAAAGETVRFRAFCPTAKGDPRWWDVTVSMVADAQGDHAGYLSVSRDVTEQQISSEALEIAAAEMKHRLKNTYMTISSLMTAFARGNDVQEAFASDMADRLVALSAAQSLFTMGEASCQTDTLIPALLSPFDNPSCPVIVSAIAETCVTQGQADAIALVVGELSVNSAKHGALAHGGEIRVSSNLDADVLKVVWIEQSAVAPNQHGREGGQGLRLMERIVRTRRGTIDVEWLPYGLRVSFAFRLA